MLHHNRNSLLLLYSLMFINRTQRTFATAFLFHCNIDQGQHNEESAWVLIPSHLISLLTSFQVNYKHSTHISHLVQYVSQQYCSLRCRLCRSFPKDGALSEIIIHPLYTLYRVCQPSSTFHFQNPQNAGKIIIHDKVTWCSQQLTIHVYQRDATANTVTS